MAIRIYSDEERKIRHHESYKKSLQKLKDEVYKAYGNYCACCGETEKLFLSLDHVNNDGNIHRKTSTTIRSKGLYWYAKQHNFPKTLQLLCMNCNSGKSRNKGICPHKSNRRK